MKSKLILSDRDVEMLFFLWRWKIATTQNLALRFFNKKSARAAYVRLWRMECAEILQSISTPDRRHHFWSLTEDSYNKIVKPRLSGLCQSGYRPEYIEHDFLVNALHLGEWVEWESPNVQFFSEQELRRLDPEFYPIWIPQSKLHRPDGYTLITHATSKRLLAYEVELSQKKLEVYENLGRFYCEDTRVDEVLWIVQNLSHAKGIQHAMEKAIGPMAKVHSFILISDFKTQHWNTEIAVGKSRGKTIGELHGMLRETGLNHVSKSRFFDTRKSLVESRNSRKGASQKFVNRVPRSRQSQQNMVEDNS